jgi:hypothetical protein
MFLSPQFKRSSQRLNASPGPPCGLITVPMDLAVMHTTNRHGELIADFLAERADLRKAQVMWVARCTSAYEAGLVGDEPAMLLVAQPDGLAATGRRRRGVDSRELAEGASGRTLLESGSF